MSQKTTCGNLSDTISTSLVIDEKLKQNTVGPVISESVEFPFKSKLQDVGATQFEDILFTHKSKKNKRKKKSKDSESISSSDSVPKIVDLIDVSEGKIEPNTVMEETKSPVEHSNELQKKAFCCDQFSSEPSMCQDRYSEEFNDSTERKSDISLDGHSVKLLDASYNNNSLYDYNAFTNFESTIRHEEVKDKTSSKTLLFKQLTPPGAEFAKSSHIHIGKHSVTDYDTSVLHDTETVEEVNGPCSTDDFSVSNECSITHKDSDHLQRDCSACSKTDATCNCHLLQTPKYNLHELDNAVNESSSTTCQVLTTDQAKNDNSPSDNLNNSMISEDTSMVKNIDEENMGCATEAEIIENKYHGTKTEYHEEEKAKKLEEDKKMNDHEKHKEKIMEAKCEGINRANTEDDFSRNNESIIFDVLPDVTCRSSLQDSKCVPDLLSDSACLSDEALYNDEDSDKSMFNHPFTSSSFNNELSLSSFVEAASNIPIEKSLNDTNNICDNDEIEILQNLDIWLEYEKMHVKTRSISSSCNILWLVGEQCDLQYAVLDTPGIKWHKTKISAHQIAVSSNSCIIWRLHQGSVYVLIGSSLKKPLGEKWIEILKDVKFIAVDNTSAW